MNLRCATRSAALALGLAALGCSTKQEAATAAVPDSGSIPPSAYATCDPAGAHDAAGFVQTASCTFPRDDAGALTICLDWAQSADGDWNPFIDTCSGAHGKLLPATCPDAGLLGVCTLPATCTTQTVVFDYGAPGSPTIEAWCGGADAGGVWTPASP